jgi:hypothetical protein
LLIARYFAGRVTWHEKRFVSVKCLQPDVLGSVEMHQRLPDGTLPDLEGRPQLLVAQGSGGSQEIAVDPGPMLVKASN